VEKPLFKVNRFTFYFCNFSIIASVVVMILSSLLALVSLFMDLPTMNGFLLSIKFQLGTPESMGLQFKALGDVRLFLVLFALVIDLVSVGIFYIFSHLKNLLNNISAGLPFTIDNAGDLNQIGNIFLVGGLSTPILSGILSYTASLMQPTISYNLELLPDLVLLFSGFLIRLLAKIFAFGSQLRELSEKSSR